MLNARTYYHGILFALITAVGLGSITTQAKLFYTEGGNAMTLMLARFLFSTLAFGIMLMARRQSLKIKPGNRLGVFLVGSVWSVAMIFYLLSVETISVSVAVLVLYSYPIMVLMYAIIVGQLSPTVRLIALFLFAFAGLYLALSGSEVVVDLQGLGFAVMAALGAAFTFIRGAKVAPMIDPLVMTFWVNLIGLVMILPLVYASFSVVVSKAGIIAISLATAFYIIAILCQFHALARLPAATAAFILNLEPIVSILLAVLILQEHLTRLQWFGVALVIFVLTLSIRQGKSARST